MRFPALLLALAIGFGGALSARGQNVVVNGDFEAPPYDTNGMLTDWVVGGNGNVQATPSDGASSLTHSAVFNAGESAGGNTLSQSFATTPGESYTLDFDAAVFGMPSSTLQLQVQATGTGLLLDQTVTPPVSNSFDAMDTNFQHYTFSFVADSSFTTLQFSDIGSGNRAADQVLDAVSVVPEPSVIALTILGAGALLGFLKPSKDSRA
jgi:hypothetical protein